MAAVPCTFLINSSLCPEGPGAAHAQKSKHVLVISFAPPLLRPQIMSISSLQSAIRSVGVLVVSDLFGFGLLAVCCLLALLFGHALIRKLEERNWKLRRAVLGSWVGKLGTLSQKLGARIRNLGSKI